MYLPAVYKERTRRIPFFDIPRNPVLLGKIMAVLRGLSRQRAASAERIKRFTIHNRRLPGTPTFRIQTFQGLASGHVVHRID
ncbi:hypothetical protein ACFLZW_01350 [Chloroflexota bacterium]